MCVDVEPRFDNSTIVLPSVKSEVKIEGLSTCGRSIVYRTHLLMEVKRRHINLICFTRETTAKSLRESLFVFCYYPLSTTFRL